MFSGNNAVKPTIKKQVRGRNNTHMFGNLLLNNFCIRDRNHSGTHKIFLNDMFVSIVKVLQIKTIGR